MVVCVVGVARGETITGQQRVWHQVTITFDGPEAREKGEVNPFTGYRMAVVFTGPEGEKLVRPGFFAADGNAAETGAAGGDQWRVRFMPTRTGEWRYQARFEKGEGVGVAEAFGTGETTAFHGTTGTFEVKPSDKTGDDFRAADRGLVHNPGGNYLRLAGSGDVWLKGGPNIPENLLGYTGFDNTHNQGGARKSPDTDDQLHHYQPHRTHWREGDPDWQRNDEDGDGKGIIGALNYIAAAGGNSIYFLPMNLGGDGQDTYPLIAPDAKTRYDVSKLAQWNIAFRHAQQRGILLHFLLAETETGNETFFDEGEMGPQRRLFFRELMARFGHHPASQWNIGEENDFGSQRREAFAAALKSFDAYDHPVTTHTHTNQMDNFYQPLLGNQNIDITSFQTTWEGDKLGDAIELWRRRSLGANVPWVVSLDEPQAIHNDPDDATRGLPSARRRFVWPAYLSGGGGVELYIQQDGGGHALDQQLEDLSRLDVAIRQLAHARRFAAALPLAAMQPADELVRDDSGERGGAQVLADAGRVYAVYLQQAGGEAALDLTDAAGERFHVRWYSPRRGEYVGPRREVAGGQWVAFGPPPREAEGASDWALVVRRAE
jgi:hypothetical protein